MMRRRSEVVSSTVVPDDSAPRELEFARTASAVEANQRSGGLKIVRAKNGMRTGTRCVTCGSMQTMTESGVTCENGHGGHGSVEADGTRVYVERDPVPAHPVHQEQYGLRPDDPRMVSGRSPDPGATVTVGRGEWLVQPIQYNSFRVAGVSVTTIVRDGETVEQAAARAYVAATEVQKKNAEMELRDYLDYLERVGAEVVRRTK